MIFSHHILCQLYLLQKYTFCARSDGEFSARLEWMTSMYGIISNSLGHIVMIAPKRKIARCNAEHGSARSWNIASRRHIVYRLAARLVWKPRMDERTSIHLPQRRALSVGCSFRWNRFSILHVALQPAPLRLTAPTRSNDARKSRWQLSHNVGLTVTSVAHGWRTV